MATVTSADTAHAQLSGTTADTVNIGAGGSIRWSAVEVMTLDTSNTVWITYATGGTTAATPVASANGTIRLTPTSPVFTIPLSLFNCTQFSIGILGNGGIYSVHGIPS